MAMIYALLILCLSGTVFGQIVNRGACQRVRGQPTIDISKYEGKWYEVARYFAIFELLGKCNYITFDPHPENNTMDANMFFTSKITGQDQAYYMELLHDSENPSNFAVKLPMTPPGYSNCTILQTDYVNYSSVFCCTEYGPINVKYAWIIAREQKPSGEVLAKALQVFDENKVSRRHLLKSDQTNCEKNQYE